jgi:hypothetical protein
MRRLTAFAFLIFAFGALAFQPGGQPQTPAPKLPIDPDTKLIMYRAVVDQEGTSGYLYDKAIEWFRAYYVNPISVFNVQDRTNGKIDGTGRMSVYHSDESGVRVNDGQVMYSIKIELKENKYRYTLTDFTLKAVSRYPIEKWMNKSDPAYTPRWDGYLYQVDTTMQRLISSLKEGMKPTVKKKDEW